MSSAPSEKQGDAAGSGPEYASPPTSLDSPKSKKYFFGAQGKALVRQISFAGGLGFFLFGYDQGVLGVSWAVYSSTQRT